MLKIQRIEIKSNTTDSELRSMMVVKDDQNIKESVNDKISKLHDELPGIIGRYIETHKAEVIASLKSELDKYYVKK